MDKHVLYFSEDLWKQLEAKAESEGTSVAALVRSYARNGLKGVQQGPSQVEMDPRVLNEILALKQFVELLSKKSDKLVELSILLGKLNTYLPTNLQNKNFVQRILDALADGPHTAIQLAETLGEPTDLIGTVLRFLEKNKLICTKRNVWELVR